MLKIDKWLSTQLRYPAYNINNVNLKNFNFFKFKSQNVLISIKSNWELEKGYKRYIEWYVDFFKKNKDKLI